MKPKTRKLLGWILLVFAILTIWIPFVPTITLTCVALAMIYGDNFK